MNIWRDSSCAFAIAAGLLGAQAASAAETSAPGAGAGGEIVVTAQRRAENIQKVPLSVSAVTGDQLAAANITSASDLNKQVPALLVVEQNNSVLPFIRGVGNTLTPPGNESSVSVYVDGVYYGRITPVLLKLNNVDQVEVLKGPQGTLFGRNSTGGLVQIKTKIPKPGDPLTLEARAGYGNFKTFDGSIYAAASLTPQVAIDLAAVIHDQHEGWGRNLTTGGESFYENAKAVGSKLVFEPTPDTRVMVTGEYAESKGNMGITASPFVFSRSPSGTLDPTPGKQILTVPTPYDTRSGQQPLGTTKSYAVSARVSHDFGIATVSNTAAWKSMRQFEGIDLDYNVLPLLAANLPSRDREFTNEFQVVSNGGGKFNWAAGVFYINMTQGFYPAEFVGAIVGAQVGGVPLASNFQSSNLNVSAVSVYGQGTYEIARDLKFTLGGRYSWDTLTGSGGQTIQVPGGPVVPIPGTSSSGRLVVRKPSFRTALDYQVDPDLLVYASVSRGYKEPVFNVLPFSPTPTRPEILTAYEVGFKSQLMDRHLTFNAAAFWYEIQNPQVQTAPRPGTAVTSNAEHGRSRGVDFELRLAASDRLSMHVAATYLDSKYTRFTNASIINPNPAFPFGNLAAVPGDVSGRTSVFAPKFSGNAGIQYRYPLASGASLTASGNAFFTSKIFFEPDHHLVQPAYAILDASLTYTSADSKRFIRVWGANLADKLYYTSGSSVGFFSGNIGTPGAPRTFGATVGIKY